MTRKPPSNRSEIKLRLRYDRQTVAELASQNGLELVEYDTEKMARNGIARFTAKHRFKPAGGDEKSEFVDGLNSLIKRGWKLERRRARNSYTAVEVAKLAREKLGEDLHPSLNTGIWPIGVKDAVHLICPDCSCKKGYHRTNIYSIKQERRCPVQSKTELSMNRIRGALSLSGVKPMFDVVPDFHQKVSWTCAEGHEWAASWAVQRHGDCPICRKGYYGENLLWALCRYIHPEDDWRKVNLPGIDPENTEALLQFDLASVERGLYFENGSEYHQGKAPKHWHADHDLIARRDKLKAAAFEEGGRLHGKVFVHVVYEQSAISKLVRESLDSGVAPAEAIWLDFTTKLREKGYAVPDLPTPTPDELFSCFNERSVIRDLMAAHGLRLDENAWLGTKEITAHCTRCGHGPWRTEISTLRRAWDNGRSGCKNCWDAEFKEDAAQRKDQSWGEFRSLCDAAGIDIVPDEYVPPERKITLRERSTGRTTTNERKYLGKRLRDRRDIFGAVQKDMDRRKDNTREKLEEIRSRLLSYDIDLTEEETKPTTEKRPDGTIVTNYFAIRYRRCGHEGSVPFGPFIQKLEKSPPGARAGFCPACRKTDKHAERSEWLQGLATAHGVELDGGRYLGATKKHRFICAGRCAEGAYEATWDNLAVKGLLCRTCREWRDDNHPGALEDLGPAPRQKIAQREPLEQSAK